MISSRYALPVILLLVLALIPTVIHTYLEAESDDGRSVKAVPEVLNGYTSVPYGRHKQEWVDDMFRSKDWIERIYSYPGKPELRLFIAKSFDHKRLYHHPELGLSHGSNLASVGIVSIEGQSEIPIHLYNQVDGFEFVGYVLLYDGKFVEDPISHQIENSLKLLVSASKPMTIFYISGSYESPSKDFRETPAATILTAAIQSYTGL